MDEEFQTILNNLNEWLTKFDPPAEGAEQPEESEHGQTIAMLALFEVLLRAAITNPSVAVNIINASNTLESSLVGVHGGVAMHNQADLFVNSLLNTCLRTHLFSEIFKSIADKAIKECEGTKNIPVQSIAVPDHLYYDPSIAKAASQRFSKDMFQQTGNKFVTEEKNEDGPVVQMARISAMESLYIFQNALDSARDSITQTIDRLREQN